MYPYFVVIGVCTLVYFLFLAFYNKIKTALETGLAVPLVNRLIENSKARSSTLIIGAVLFLLGFIL